MGLRGWIRSHPVASCLIAFLLVVGLAAGGLALYVLSDQRRSGQLLSYTLREALGLEIHIERVVTAGPDRLVLKGVSVPGTSLDLRAPEVRVEGPLLSLLTHRSGELSLTAIGLSITLPSSEPGVPPVLLPLGIPPETLATIRETARQFLSEPFGLSLKATDGILRRGGERTSFSLQFAKEQSQPKATLTLQIGNGASGSVPLSIASSLTHADDTLLMRIGVEGSPAPILLPGLGPVRATPDTRLSAETALRLPRAATVEIAGQLSAGPLSIGDLPLTRSVQLGLLATYRAEGERLEIRRLTLDAGSDTHITAEGTLSGSQRREVMVTFRQNRIDGSLVRAFLPSAPGFSGIIEIPDLTLSARMDGTDPIPFSRMRGRLKLPALLASPGYPVSGARVDLDLSLERESGAGTIVARGLLRADSLAAGPLTIERARVPYVVRLDRTGTLLSGETRPLSGHLWGAPVTAAVVFEGGGRKISARVDGRSVDLSRWAEGAGLKDLPWDSRSPMRIASLSGTLEASLDSPGSFSFREAAVRFEGGPVEHGRPGGSPPLKVERFNVKANLGAASAGREPLRSVTGTFSIAGVRGLAGLRGELAQISGRVSLRAALERNPGPVEISDGLIEVFNEARRPLLRLTARPWAPRSGRPFLAVAVAVELPDLSLIQGHLSDLSQRLEGSANARFRLWKSSAQEPIGHEGELTLRIMRGEFLQGSLTVQNLRAELPVKGEADMTTGESGEMTADVVSLYGVTLRAVRSPARVVAGMVNLSDLRYDLYGGKGSGWIEASLGNAVTLRTRLEGEQVDLDRLVREYPIQGGTITGRLRYTIGFRYSPAQGAEVGGTMAAGEPGGTVSISFLRRLLGYAEADPTGILRQTLANLSEFPYRTLDLDVRTVGGVTRLDLKLVGKGSFFGLLPPKVREINIKNLPLDFLVRTFSQG